MVATSFIIDRMVASLSWSSKPYAEYSPSCEESLKRAALSILVCITLPVTLPIAGLVYLGVKAYDCMEARRVNGEFKRLQGALGLPEDSIQKREHGHEPDAWLKWTVGDDETTPTTTIAVVDRFYGGYGIVIGKMLQDAQMTRSTAFVLVYTDISKLDGDTLKRVVDGRVSEIKTKDFVLLHRADEQILGDFGNMCINSPYTCPLRKGFECRLETFK